MMSQPNHNLFRDYYLDRRLETARTRYYPAPDKTTFTQIAKLWHSKQGSLSGSEDNVADLVKGICKILGMEYAGQTKVRSAGDTSQRIDLTLFASAEIRDSFVKAKSSKKKAVTRYAAALTVVEVEHLGKKLETGKNDNSNPSQQIINYLAYAKLPWGVLTDGAIWRLYRRFDPSDRTRYLELNLQEIIETNDEMTFYQWFFPFFSRIAFDRAAGDSFLDAVWAGSEQYEAELQDSLRIQAFAVVESLAQGIYAAAPTTDMDRLYEQSIVILYRLLFIKFAEDRQILPDSKADESQKTLYRKTYGFTVLQNDILTALDQGDPLSNLPAATGYWNRLNKIFETLYNGEPAFGIPPYDGTLFKAARLTGISVTDEYLAQAIDRLARIKTAETAKARVDYRDLTVRHLGSIYEGLLEYHLELNATSVKLTHAGGDSERKTTGSYYTPDSVVQYIVTKTIEPLVQNRTAAQIEQIKIVDPAMGSGHFLVTALEYLAYYHAWAIKREQAAPCPPGVSKDEWEEENRPTADERSASERLLVDRCIYGVDLNPLAVELAKLALWLSTLSADRPLYFLDHHLRVGNSLTGAWKSDLRLTLPKRKKTKRQTDAQLPLFDENAMSQAMHAALDSLGKIANEGTQANVEEQQTLYRALRQDLDGKYGRLADLVTATHFGLNMPVKQLRELSGRAMKNQAIETLKPVQDAGQIAGQNRFFHWQFQFPDIFFDAHGNDKPEAGFDAVIGNPPYVRAETLGADAKRYFRRYAVYAGSADLYVYFFEQGLKLLKQNGRLSFIVSNSWLKTGYAQALRKMLRDQTVVESLVDLGDNRVFAAAPDVYPAIPVLKKETPPTKYSAQVAVFSRGEQVSLAENDLMAKWRSVSMTDQPDTGWQMESSAMRTLFAKISQGKQTLHDYCGGGIYRGVLTGLNEAFIIDGATRAQLIAADPASEPLLKPLINGQDVRPWYTEDEDRWLIFTRRGININQYPSIKAHLEKFKTELEPRPVNWNTKEDGPWPGRKPGRYEWYEIQDAVDYYAEFEKPKIFWPEMSKYPRFVLSPAGIVGNKTTFMIPLMDEDYYLLGVLMSRATWFAVTNLCQSIGERAGILRYMLSAQFIQKLPIPNAVAPERTDIANLAQQLTTTAQKRYKLHRSVRHRILADLGGIDSRLNQKLTAWWGVPDFKAFQAEVKKAFKKVIPLKERDDWEAYLAEQQAAHQTLTQSIITTEQALNQRVYVLFNLSDPEIELIEDATKYQYGEI